MTLGRNRIKIAFVMRTMSIGGAEGVTLNLGIALQSLGYEITIVTTSHPGAWFERIVESGLSSLHIEGRFQNHPYRHAWNVGRILRKQDYDVIIFTNSERFGQAALHMLPDKLIVITWIRSAHEDAYNKAIVNKNGWNVAVGVGPEVTRAFQVLVPENKVIYIPNGHPSPTAEQYADRLPHCKPLRLCYVGRITDDKGVFLLPQVIKKCVDACYPIELNILGDGEALQKLKNEFDDASLRHLVTFHGAVSNIEVYRHLLHSHVLLLPSYYEGLPGTVIEAQLCGCVPIATMLPGVTDAVIKAEKTGFLVEDIDGFFQAIGRLMYDASLWRELSNSGHRHAIELFSLDVMAQRFDELIHDCMNQKYPLSKPRKSFLPINIFAFTWREAIPRGIHRLGLGSLIRRCIGVN